MRDSVAGGVIVYIGQALFFSLGKSVGRRVKVDSFLHQ